MFRSERCSSRFAISLGRRLLLATAAVTMATTAQAQTGSADRCASIAQASIPDGAVVSAERFSRGGLVFGNINVATLLFGGDSLLTASTDFCRVKIQLKPTANSLINVEV